VLDDRLPALAGDQQARQREVALRLRRRRGQRLLLAPEPAEGVGQDRAEVLAAVAVRAEDGLVVIPRECERGDEVMVAERPVAMDVVEVLLPFLEEDAEGLALGL